MTMIPFMGRRAALKSLRNLGLTAAVAPLIDACGGGGSDPSVPQASTVPAAPAARAQSLTVKDVSLPSSFQLFSSMVDYTGDAVAGYVRTEVDLRSFGVTRMGQVNSSSFGDYAPTGQQSAPPTATQAAAATSFIGSQPAANFGDGFHFLDFESFWLQYPKADVLPTVPDFPVSTASLLNYGQTCKTWRAALGAAAASLPTAGQKFGLFNVLPISDASSAYANLAADTRISAANALVGSAAVNTEAPGNPVRTALDWVDFVSLSCYAPYLNGVPGDPTDHQAEWVTATNNVIDAAIALRSTGANPRPDLPVYIVLWPYVDGSRSANGTGPAFSATNPRTPVGADFWSLMLDTVYARFNATDPGRGVTGIVLWGGDPWQFTGRWDDQQWWWQRTIDWMRARHVGTPPPADLASMTELLLADD